MYLEDVSYNSQPLADEVTDLEEEDLLNLLQYIPDGCQTIFNLFVIEGYSHKEIAEMLDIEESTSRSQYTRAKQMLEDILVRKKIIMRPKEKINWLGVAAGR